MRKVQKIEEEQKLLKDSESSIQIELDDQEADVESRYAIKEQNIETFNFVKLQFFGTTFFTIIFQIYNIVIALTILQVLNKNDHTFKFLFLILTLAQFIYIIALIAYRCNFQSYAINMIVSTMNIANNTMKLLLFLGLYLYSKNTINLVALQLFILPGFIYCSLDILYKNYKYNIADLSQAFNLLFWIQVELIFFNMFMNLPWNIIIAIWTIQYFIYRVFSYLIISVVILTLVVLLSTCKCKLKFEFYAYTWTSLVFFSFAVYMMFYYNFVLTLIRVFEDDLFKTNFKLSLQSSLPILQVTAQKLFIYMVVLMPMLFISYLVLSYKLRKKLIRKEKIFQIYTLAKEIRLKLIRKSTEYFKKKDQFQEELENFDKESYCVICKDQKNEIILRPCGHTSICVKCLEKHLESKKICPYCRKKILKAYVIKYDKTNKAYFVKKIIKMGQLIQFMCLFF